MSQMIENPHAPVTIRPAVPADAVPLRALRVEALGSNPTAFASEAGRAAAEPDETWVQRIRDSSGAEGIICLAEAGGELVGMLGCRRGDRPKTRHSGTVWGVYVQPGRRGLGVAEALLELSYGWAQANGLVVQKLAVVTHNGPAIRCYLRCGYTIYGVEPQALFYAGVYYDELLMARQVGRR